MGSEMCIRDSIKVKSQVIKGMCIACLLLATLPLDGDFQLYLMNLYGPFPGKLTKIFAPESNPHHLPALCYAECETLNGLTNK